MCLYTTLRKLPFLHRDVVTNYIQQSPCWGATSFSNRICRQLEIEAVGSFETSVTITRCISICTYV